MPFQLNHKKSAKRREKTPKNCKNSAQNENKKLGMHHLTDILVGIDSKARV